MANTKEYDTEIESEAGTRVEWDDSKMSTTYSNVANAASTREEVALLFGTNTTWKTTGDQAVKIELNNRIILSPYAAKRFKMLLTGVIDEYESRFGELDITPAKKTPVDRDNS
jgi:hypothetical protein